MDATGPHHHRKGGQGVGVILANRENPSRVLGLPDRYWAATIFTWRGRPTPILPQLVYAIYCAVVVVALIQVLKAKHWVNGKPDKYYKETMDLLKALQFPVASVGTALFLLLAFRTNSCYDRWWEGRKLLDGVASKSLDLARMALVFVAPVNQQLAQQMLSWVIVMAHAIKWNLRREKALEDISHLLEHEEEAQLAAARFPVQACAHQLSGSVQEVFMMDKCPVPPAFVAQLDNNIRGMLTDANACARIVTTPLPFAYIVHLRSFMILWLAAVPFAFVPSLGYHSIYVAAIMAYMLFGFEEIGVEIENPFGRDFNDLPVDIIIHDLQTIVEDCKARIDAEARNAVEGGIVDVAASYACAGCIASVAAGEAASGSDAGGSGCGGEA